MIHFTWIYDNEMLLKVSVQLLHIITLQTDETPLKYTDSIAHLF